MFDVSILIVTSSYVHLQLPRKYSPEYFEKTFVESQQSFLLQIPFAPTNWFSPELQLETFSVQ